MTTEDDVLLLIGAGGFIQDAVITPRIQIRELSEFPMRSVSYENRRVAVYRVPRRFALEYIAAEAAFANCEEMLRASPRYKWVQHDELVEISEPAKETAPL